MITVIYGNQVYGEYAHWVDIRHHISPSMDVFHGGYVYSPKNNPGVDWYRCDGTPVLPNDVPPMCKAWVLILGD